MFKFEFIKTNKKKIFLLFIISAFLVSFITYKSNNFAIDSYINNQNTALSYIYSGIDIYSDEYSSLTNEEKDEYGVSQNIIMQAFYKDINNAKNNNDKEKTAFDIRESVIKQINENKKLLEKMSIETPLADRLDFKWTDLEVEKMIENDTRVTDLVYGSYSSNPMRVLITLSPIFFGILPIFLLLISFASTISKEKNLGNIVLLETQPINKIKILFSKEIIMLLSAIIYFLSVVLFTIIIGFLMGQKWYNGHLEIYRIFSTDGNLYYIYAYKLLLKIFLAYIIMVIFYSSLILLLSEKMKDSLSVIIITSGIFIILSIITKSFDSFKVIYNPLFAINYKDNILGRVSVINKAGNWVTKYTDKSNFGVYYIYFLISIFMSYLSLLISKRDLSFVKKKDSKFTINSLWAFEFFKILKDKNFSKFIYSIFLIFIILCLSFFIKDKKFAKDYKENLPIIFMLKLDSIKSTAEMNLKSYREDLGFSIDSEEYKRKRKCGMKI